MGGGSDEDNLEPTPLTSLDNVYEDNEDDELVDSRSADGENADFRAHWRLDSPEACRGVDGYAGGCAGGEVEAFDEPDGKGSCGFEAGAGAEDSGKSEKVRKLGEIDGCYSIACCPLPYPKKLC